MYTSYIGKKFVELYNQKTANTLSAADFFEQVMFPIFFEPEMHLMHVHSSPFFQPITKEELAQSGLKKSTLQLQKLKTKVNDVESGARDLPDASFFVGFSANGPSQVTSGQLSGIKFTIDAEDIYASWIGNALSIRVEGSQCLLTDSEIILWHLYEGWQCYRDYLNQTPVAEGRQIETWNGQWLAKGSDPDLFTASAGKDGKRLETHPWLEVLYALSCFHPNEKLSVYVFSLGQTNTTVGFINFHLPQVSSLGKLAATLVELKDKPTAQIWREYQSEYSLIKAIQLFGEIGLKALKPKDFHKLLEEKLEQTKLTEKNKTSFHYFKLWILAMLNNKIELQALAADMARVLRQQETKDTRTKAFEAQVKNVMETKSLRPFIEALTNMLENNQSLAPAAKSVVDIALRMPAEQFPLFKALLRFEYVYQKAV